MQSRRDFLRNAAVLTGAGFVPGFVPEAIARAMAIDPERGTTFRDAEHVVILMQENRSFDHVFGALQGVRGFRDPRAHVQPDGRPVWFQTDAHGATYAPFPLDIKGTNATWIGGLPHSWTDQVDARNGGRYDKWLVAKPRKDLPMTLGHYTREDVPFYYAFADAFTVCDGHFCSSLTGTTPNRLYLWSGTIREKAESFARVNNDDAYYDTMASWTTFPERLEKAGVSWRVYQNGLYLDTGYEGEEDGWLGNFGDNPLEYYEQYNVYLAKDRRAHMARLAAGLPRTIEAKEKTLQLADITREAAEGLVKEIAELKARLKKVEEERTEWTDERWAALSLEERAIHERAFAVNDGDPDYRMLETLRYRDGETEREVRVPKGDVLHRFREDVTTGELPRVSWIVAPENFSDHPTSAWYGAWYVSEVLDILTKDPEVWKKTVFILTYDENDGYFDHVPPFVAPFPNRPETGRASEGLDTAPDVVTMASELAHGKTKARAREHAIGLGYRVPMIVASPWSRGGCVNSQVFDHTSVLQFLETWLAGKGTKVRETNVSDWRRTVCGDLTSSFRPYHGEKVALPTPLARDATVEAIHGAKYRKTATGGKPLSKDEVAVARVGAAQEPGTRPSCPLPYELAVNAVLNDPKGLTVVMEAKDARLGEGAQGAPFNAYSYGETMACRSYAVRDGGKLRYSSPVEGAYHVRVDGPNGFMREFKGDGFGAVAVSVGEKGGKLEVRLHNGDRERREFEIHDESYGAPVRRKSLASAKVATVVIDPAKSHGWYDLTVRCGDLAYRYAGRVETGKWSVTDPAMGGAETVGSPPHSRRIVMPRKTRRWPSGRK